MVGDSADSAAVVGRSAAAELRDAGEMLNEKDHARIDDAIAAVESKTAGDIYCIVAREASDYRDIALAWAVGVALIMPVLVLLAGLWPQSLARAFEGWTSVQAASRLKDVTVVVSAYALVQALLFAVTALILSVPSIKRTAIPEFVKRHRTLRMAQQHFASTGLHLGREQPHVLIFLALFERRVEILAEDAVHRIAGDATWQRARDAVSEGMRGADPTSGIVRAIAIAGQPLIEHFPATRGVDSEGMTQI